MREGDRFVQYIDRTSVRLIVTIYGRGVTLRPFIGTLRSLYYLLQIDRRYFVVAAAFRPVGFLSKVFSASFYTSVTKAMNFYIPWHPNRPQNISISHPGMLHWLHWLHFKLYSVLVYYVLQIIKNQIKCKQPIYVSAASHHFHFGCCPRNCVIANTGSRTRW